jgi:hypothetical protein
MSTKLTPSAPSLPKPSVPAQADGAEGPSARQSKEAKAPTQEVVPKEAPPVDTSETTHRPQAPDVAQDSGAQRAAGLRTPTQDFRDIQIDAGKTHEKAFRGIGDTVAEVFTLGFVETYSFNDKPLGRELERLTDVGADVGDANPHLYGALLARPGGRERLAEEIKEKRPDDQSWSFAAQALTDGIESRVSAQTESAGALLVGIENPEVKEQLLAIYADHGADDRAYGALEHFAKARTFQDLPSDDQQAYLSAFERSDFSPTTADALRHVAGLDSEVRQVAATYVGSRDAARVQSLSQLVQDSKFQALDSGLQSDLLRASYAANVDAHARGCLANTAYSENFQQLSPQEQRQTFAAFNRSENNKESLALLQSIATSDGFSELSSEDRATMLRSIQADAGQPAALLGEAESLHIKAGADARTLVATKREFLANKDNAAEVLQNLAARQIEFVYQSGGTTYVIGDNPAALPHQESVSLRQIMNQSEPEAALRQAVPGLETRDFGALLTAISEGDAHNVRIDISDNARAAKDFGLGDSIDGNAFEALSQQLRSRENLLEMAESFDAEFSYKHDDQEISVDGQQLAEIYRLEDSAQREAVFAEQFPGLNRENFEKFFSDFSTMPDHGQWDIANNTLNEIDGEDHALGLLGTGEYTSMQAQGRIRELGRGTLNLRGKDRAEREYRLSAFNFQRQITLSGIHQASSSQHDNVSFRDMRQSASQNRVFVAATGQTEVGYESTTRLSGGRIRGGGLYTTSLLGKLRGDDVGLGQALEQSHGFASRNQLATLSGDANVLDTVAIENQNILLINCSEFPYNNDLPGTANDVARLDRALQGKGYAEGQIAKLANPSKAQALSAMRAQIDGTQAGNAVVIYTSSHGGEGGILMADENSIENREIQALYKRAEDQGVRLVFISDSCHSGAQVDVVREGEIRRLEKAGEDMAALRPADRIRDNVVRLRKSMNRRQYRSELRGIDAEFRAFSEKGFESWVQSSLTKEGEVGAYALEQTNPLEQLRSSNGTFTRLETLVTRWREEQNNGNYDGIDGMSPEKLDALDGYYQFIRDTGNRIADIESDQVTILNDLEQVEDEHLRADIQTTISSSLLMGRRPTSDFRRRSTVELIDRFDSVLFNLIEASNVQAEQAQSDSVDAE